MKRKILQLLGIMLLISMIVTTAFADDGPMFRKNVSSNPEGESEHAALKMLPLYVPPQSSDGTLLTEGIDYFNSDGTLVETREYVRPLIGFYTDGHVTLIEEEGYGGFPGHGERDAFGAVSLDDGATWNRTNLSNSADESSFKIKLGGRQKYAYPGDVGRTFLAADGNKVLAVWVSRYCGSGNPTYAITEAEQDLLAPYLVAEGLVSDVTACTDEDPTTVCTYLEDSFGVAGSQGSSDLADEGLPLVGELPYACMWSARGTLQPPGEDGLSTFSWFKAERLSSGVRDANRPEAVCVKGAGCVATWQEDPEGIRPGEGEGPGEGWSGAIAHHQTDTWYSYISWDDFDLVTDDTDTYGTFYNTTGSIADWLAANPTGRPKASVPMSVPVRLTDNSMCAAQDDTEDSDSKAYCYIDYDGSGIADFCASTVSVEIETPEGPTSTIDMCVTEDGRLMRGNTASTRARLGLHGYSSTVDFNFDPNNSNKDDVLASIDSAWFSMSYEENKGLGEDGEEVEVSDDPAEKIDMGKNVWYHTFDMFHPELVSQGLMLNQPAIYPDDFSDPLGLLSPDDSLGYNFFTIDPDPIYETQAGIDTTLYQTEISRRPSPISQEWYDVGDSRTVAFHLWKQGIIRRGGPADIMGRRFVIPDEFDSRLDNPYDYGNMVCEDGWAFDDGSNPRYIKGLCPSPAVNLSGNTILTGECGDTTACQDAFPFSEYFDDLAGGTAIPKIWTWEQYGPGYGASLPFAPEETSFDDTSWEDPYDVAKGHRGFLRGDMLMTMYAWSPNWMANTVGHDNYNLYNRRSFDGGMTWSTTPASLDGNGTTTCEWMGPAGSDTEYPVCTTYAAGEFEQTRNVSQLVGNKVTILDPRYSPTARSITAISVSTPSLPEGFFAPEYDDDTRDPSRYFMVYETGDNTTVAVGEAEPLDLFYSRAINWGDDYLVWQDTADTSACLPSAEVTELVNFCNEFDALEGSQFYESGEASITTSPGGTFFYAVWNQIDFDNDGHEIGSDVWFRRVLFLDDYVPGETPTNGTPNISISSPADGAIFASDDEITFSGTASDVEDGDLSSSIVWTSSIDGAIGTGTGFSVVLSAGTHAITATVTDTGTLTTIDEISITVEEEAPVNEPPTVLIDSPADDETFASGTEITFSATASDLEDGDLSSTIVWEDNGTYLGSGANISAVLSDGPHTITAAVTDSGTITTIAEINITVATEAPADQLGVEMTTSQDVYTRGETLQIEAVVTDNNGNPVDGATVTVLIEFPKLAITKTAVTNASGVAVVSYKLSIRTGFGTAKATSTVTKTGYDDGFGTITFEVR